MTVLVCHRCGYFFVKGEAGRCCQSPDQHDHDLTRPCSFCEHIHYRENVMLLKFQCQGCGAEQPRFAQTYDEAPGACTACGGGDLRREPTAPSLKSIETLDNGLMARPAERLKDGERLAYIRSRPGPAIE